MDIRLNTADDSAYDALSDDLELPGDDLNELTSLPVPKGAKATVMSSIFNLANNIMGAGMLVLPWAMAQSSLIPGLLLMLMAVSDLASESTLVDFSSTLLHSLTTP